MVVRKETPSAGKINFSIVKVIVKLNRNDTIYSEISDELSDFKDDIVQWAIHRTSESDSVREKTNNRPDKRRREHTGGGLVNKKLRFLSR